MSRLSRLIAKGYKPKPGENVTIKKQDAEQTQDIKQIKTKEVKK